MNAQAFPSLVIGVDDLRPQGAYASAQADYLRPDEDDVARLTQLLRRHDVGVVAHYYMDPELQGVLTASDWPHVHISDSLMMADAAIEMVRGGARVIVVLGVDFMSENVRAMLDASGYGDVPVYRVASDPIGCSLAEAADSLRYGAYLTQAAQTPRSLHVVYVNTSLRTKAQAEALVPTITCTSSNVIRTILQARAQIPDLHVWYGPDTYMGHNLRQFFTRLAEQGDDAVVALHPEHDAASIRALVEHLHTFEQGVCIVHHMFGGDVADRVRRDYADAFVTAHLEVPGEMFEVGLAAQDEGRGVVGSTADILTFIGERVKEAVAAGASTRLRFVLGTEAGMVTSIVHRVQGILREHRDGGGPCVEAEIVFPVASEAVAASNDAVLGIVPGVMAGEGCSVAGGCATCPFMKMNSLDALLDTLETFGKDPSALERHRPAQYAETIAGPDGSHLRVAELGGRTIIAMRSFQRTGRLPDELVRNVLGRRPGQSRVENAADGV
jgi:quinolinate synthase